ncbi:MAG: RsbRD N-terminal domain-containing protein, partial [Candidatus Binatia bacterium]
MSLSRIVSSERGKIVERWLDRARESTSQAADLSRRELEDNLPGVLDELIRALA